MMGQETQTNLKLETTYPWFLDLWFTAGLGNLFFALSLHRKLHHTYFIQTGVELGWTSSLEKADSSLQGWNLGFRECWFEFLLVFLIIVHFLQFGRRINSPCDRPRWQPWAIKEEFFLHFFSMRKSHRIVTNLRNKPPTWSWNHFTALFSGAIWEAERAFLHMGLLHINRGHLLYVSAKCLDFSETHEKMILI